MGRVKLDCCCCWPNWFLLLVAQVGVVDAIRAKFMAKLSSFDGHFVGLATTTMQVNEQNNNNIHFCVSAAKVKKI